MRMSAVRHLVVSAMVWLLCSSAIWADLHQYHVSLDLNSLGISDAVRDVELEIALYNDNGVSGDSWARVDNVVLGSTLEDFTASDPFGSPGFERYLNPDNVTRVDIWGDGAMLIDDTGGSPPWPVLAYKDYLDRDGDTLYLDIAVDLGSQSGFWGGDRLVLSLLDPWTLSPLVSGLSGLGDVAVISKKGLSVVPVPGACLLAILGFGSAGLKLRKRSQG